VESSSTSGLLSVEEYLELEKTSSVKHEYVAGEIHAMTGASGRHNRIAGNIFAALWNAARGGACRVFQSDMKVRAADDVFYYPDILVACDEPPEDPYYVEPGPCLVVEVVSPSTEATDRREKLAAYKRMPTLKAYLIVFQERQWVERHFRDEDGVWHKADLVDEGRFPVPCPPDAWLSLDEVYEGL
jgi:Uma2 family endonuclease